MQDILNLTNANGEVITLFDGRMTLSQALAVVITIAIVFFVMKVVKKTLKLVFTVAAICACLVYFNIASPAQIKDAATQIANAGVESYKTIVDSSKNIRMEGGDIQVNIADNWVDISDITSIVDGDSGKATVVVNGQSYVVEDTVVIQLLKSFT